MSKAETTDPRVERTRERVMEAAQRLMCEGGPSAVTYSALTRESGVGRATIYRHWPSLDDLWPELIREVTTSVMPEPTGDLRADLLKALRMRGTRVGTREGLVHLLAMLERAQWDEHAAMLVRLAAEHNPVRQIVAHARAAGTIDESTDLDLATALLTGPMLHRLVFEGGELDEAFLESVVDNYIDGPAGPGRQAEARRA